MASALAEMARPASSFRVLGSYATPEPVDEPMGRPGVVAGKEPAG